MSPASQSLTELLALKETSENEYTTLHNPERMGNSLPIAYGGFALAVATKSASLSVPAGYHLYTIMGTYLGPAQTDRPLLSSISTIRQTRTFATRSVTVSQQQDDGSRRACLHAIADFQVPEPRSLMQYSAPPTKPYTHFSRAEDGVTLKQHMVNAGTITQDVADAHTKSFGLLSRIYEMRPCPEGLMTQNLTGVMKHLPTTQDSLPVYEKAHADWFRARHALPSYTDRITCLAFLMDAAISFAPLSFSGMFLEDCAACSSLDFALRVFGDGGGGGGGDGDGQRGYLMMDEDWFLKEITTSVGAGGRTYSEARLFDGVGGCVASLSQVSILRPYKEGKGTGKGKL
jgi:acyl-CoA thioesterase